MESGKKRSERGKVAEAPPAKYALGDGLNWNAPWIDVQVCTELPFWLMVSNTTLLLEYEGHEFPISIYENYHDLFLGVATDSRSTVGYRGPAKQREDLPASIKGAMNQHPTLPYMWRKCKTYLKVRSRCNEDVWNAANNDEMPRANEARLYLAELCRAHIPVVNKLIQAYRLATYDYFPYEVSVGRPAMVGRT
jgi:hypothetical protein